MAIAEVGQVGAFALPVAGLLVDRECLLVELDRAAYLPQRRVTEAEVAEAGAVGPWVGEVAWEAVVQLKDEAVVAPHDEVVEVDPSLGQPDRPDVHHGR